MKYQSGFTLFELMIAIAVIAILSATAIPAYQGYIQKAALTDTLQTTSGYRSAVELCYLDEGALQGCTSGQRGVPASRTTRYLDSVAVSQGSVSLLGKGPLQGLSVTLRPVIEPTTGELVWQRVCNTVNNSLREACQSVFRFEDGY